MTTVVSKKASKSAKLRRQSTNALIYVVLTILSVVWLIPIMWIVFSAFRADPGSFTAKFVPDSFTFQNFIDLWENPVYPFRQWFLNTFIVAVATCAISTAISNNMLTAKSMIRRFSPLCIIKPPPPVVVMLPV